MEKSTTGGNQTGCWSCKLGKVLSRAKVFNECAVPQGLCANLINALKLLANQAEDGDGLVQNIVTNLGEVSRKGLTDGLRTSSGWIMSAPWMLLQKGARM